MSYPSTFAADARRLPDALWVTVSGELDLGSEPVVVQMVTQAVAQDSGRRIVIDLTGVTFIDSSGLRALLQCRDNAQRRARLFALRVGENARVRGLLRLAGVEGWFSYE